MRIWIVPAMMPSKKRASKASRRPAKGASALKITSEMALVGPLIKCDDEPRIEATIVMTIAEYKP